MKRQFLLTSVVFGCVACVSPSIPQQETVTATLEESLFEDSYQALEAAKTAGEACLVNREEHLQKHACPTQPTSYDRDACVKFDEAIQMTLEPLRACSDPDFTQDTPSRLQHCKDYIAAFLSRCAGVHALQLAYNERERSQAYREAVANGLSEAEATEIYLQELVRYRD